MAQICTVCSHKDIEAINRELVSGVANTRIAANYGLKETAVRYHKKMHLPEHLAKSKEAELVTDADELMTDLKYLKTKAITLLGLAERESNFGACAALLSQARQVIETLAEVRGELDRKATVNIFVNSQFLQVQSIILSELEDFPEVRAKIVNKLTEVNT